MAKYRTADREFGFIRMPPRIRYALEGARVLARDHGKGRMGVGRIAARCGVPAEFLSKIFTRLTELRPLASQRGPGGGYALTRRPDEISVAEFLRALPGPDTERRRCLIGQQDCGREHPCAVHATALEAERILAAKFSSLTLADLLESA